MKHVICVAAILLFQLMAFGQIADPTGDLAFTPQPMRVPASVSRTLALDETFAHLDPGLAPEGDYLGKIAFSPDGNRVFLLNRTTNNISVFDWATMEAETTFSTGVYPSDIVITATRIAVSCAFSDSVRIYDAQSYALLASIPTGEQPWVMKTSPDGQYAYVACDIANTCEKIDLNSLTHQMTIHGFPIGLTTWWANTGSGRNDFGFTDFLISPNGQYIIVSDCISNLLYYRTDGGVLPDSIIPGIPNCASYAFSGDNSKLIVTTPIAPAYAYQVDWATQTVLDSVALNGYPFNGQLAVNQDGSKCFMGLDNNRSGIVRFATHDVVVFTSTYSAFWAGVTPDHRYAISGQYRFSIIDLVTDEMVGQVQGYGQYRGAVSPVGYRIASHDPFRIEDLMFFEINGSGQPSYRGQTVSGGDPEGDAPHRVTITPDGHKAVASNFLSNNVSIFNLDTQELEDILPCGDGPWDIAITSDSRWAAVCGFNSNSVIIIDLQNYLVVADVSAGGRPMNLVISPDDQYAYAANALSNTISVIALNGSQSAELAELPCGEIGILWAAYGVPSGIAISPDGDYIAVAASFDDVVHVINTNTDEDVLVPTGDFPLDVTFAGNSNIVCSNWNDNTYTIMAIAEDGTIDASTHPTSGGAMRVAYNPATDEVGIGCMSEMYVRRINPQSGAITGQTSYGAYGPIMDLAYSQWGDEIVMTASNGNNSAQLHRGIEHTILPAEAACFDMTLLGDKAAVAMPGPDYVTIVEYEGVNHPPSDFSLLLPMNNDTIPYGSDGTVTVVWQRSFDPDTGSSVHYEAEFRLLSADVNTTLLFRNITDPSVIVDLMDSADVEDWDSYVRVQWRIHAFSGSDSVWSREQWIFRLEPPLGIEPQPALTVPQYYSLSAHPNPFNPETTLEFALPKAAHVKLAVYDMIGREVALLADRDFAAQIYRARLNAARWPSGIYFARLQANEQTLTAKLMLIR